jgi:hypothetical protein
VLGPERFREVRYDRLVASPEDELREVCSFLGEDYDPVMLDVAGAARATGLGELAHHQNLLRPLTPGLRDWRGKWSEREKVAVEVVVGPVLDELGFPRACPAPSRRTVKLVRAQVGALRRAYRLREWAGWKVKGVAKRLGLR